MCCSTLLLSHTIAIYKLVISFSLEYLNQISSKVRMRRRKCIILLMPFNFCLRGQLEIGFKIDAVEAVAMKLLQRLNYSASVMKTSAAHLQEGKIAFFRICILFELSRLETPNLYTQLANLTQMACVLRCHSYLSCA